MRPNSRTRWLAAGVVVLALGVAAPARAQLTVVCPTCDQVLTQALQFAKEVEGVETEVSQLRQIENINQVGTQQLQELTNFYTSFSHTTSVTGLAPMLLQPSTINALPALSQIETTLSGQGFTGTLARDAQALLTSMQFYKPVGTDQAASWINSQATSSAGYGAAAHALYGSAGDRIVGLQDLMGQVAIAGDPSQRMDLMTRATIENGYAASQGNQALALAILQRAQADAALQQVEQRRRQDADSLVADTQALP